MTMGSFNKAAPFDETRYETIPAQPGWFTFIRQGPRTDYRILKTPIVAWLTKTTFAPPTEWNGRQGFFSMAYPVPGGNGDGDMNDRIIVLGPDNCVYQLDGGACWPDIDSFIQYDCDRLEAEEVKEAARAAELERNKR